MKKSDKMRQLMAQPKAGKTPVKQVNQEIDIVKESEEVKKETVEGVKKKESILKRIVKKLQ